VGKDRFRINLWVSSANKSEKFMEDAVKVYKLPEMVLQFSKPAGRCTMVNVRDDGTRDKAGDVLELLKRYRGGRYEHLAVGSEHDGPQCFFGVNIAHKSGGIIKVGDRVEVAEWNEEIAVKPVVGKGNVWGEGYE